MIKVTKTPKIKLDTEKDLNKFFSSYKRIIIKVGSSLLVNKKTRKIRSDWLEAFSKDVSSLLKINKEIIIVSSGAIALGRNSINSHNNTLNLQENQAAASVGQIELAYSWKDALEKEKIKCAQILLSPDDTETRRRHLNARATIATLIKSKIVPVINENDTVTTSEIKFGDNDRLAARVAQMSSSDLLILLSDIDGLYNKNPHQHKNSKHIPIGLLVSLIIFLELIIVVGGWKYKPGIFTSSSIKISSDITNTHSIGNVLYTDYIHLFQISGMILLVAMIGAIILTFRKRDGLKTQSYFKQISREKDDGVELIKVKSKEGVKFDV